MCYSSRFSEARKRLEVHNSIIGYAFLVDREGHVRWRAHGKPTERELEAMTNCCRQLLTES